MMNPKEEPDPGLTTLSVSRRSSQGSTVSTRTRKTSRIEAVKVGGARVLIEVEDANDEGSSITRRNSIGAQTTMGAVSVTAIENEIMEDKIINRELKKEMGHHSKETERANANGNKIIPEETSSYKARIKKWTACKDGTFASVFFYVFHHLHLAFATPSLIRIPHLAHKYASKNGSDFILVYFICLMAVGLPICVLETTMAQYSSLGPVNIFDGCLPLIKGIGYGMVLTCAMLMVLTSTLLSWSFFYLCHSATSDLPWASCPTNMTNGCKEIKEDQLVSLNSTSVENFKFIKIPYIPSDYYFQMNVTRSLEVEVTDSLELNFTLTAMLIILWPMILFFLSRHYVWRVKLLSSCFAIATLGIFLALVFNGMNLENSGRGLGQVFHLDFDNIGSELNKPDLWLDCLGQVFWSLGPCIGFLLSRTSYNNFRRKIVKEVVCAIFFNLFVQYLVILAVFPYNGHLYKDTFYKNLGYFFVIGSYAVTRGMMPSASAFILFLCISESLFTHIVMLADTVVITLTDSLAIKWRSGMRRFSIEFLVCLFGFLGSLLFVTKEGLYYLSTTDRLVPWVAGMSLGFVEISALVYVFGTKRIKLHFHKMQNSKTVHISICKYFVAPALLAILVWTAVVGISDPLPWDHTETVRMDSYFKVGLALAILPIALSFAIFCIDLLRNRGNLKNLIKPSVNWSSAVSRHSELLTKAHHRRDKTIPWLIIQGSATAFVPQNLASWIPYGYSWIPQNRTSKLLKEGFADMSYPTRRGLAMLLVDHFSQIGQKRIFNLVDNDENSPILASQSTDNSDLGARTRKTAIVENDYLSTCSASTLWIMNNYFHHSNLNQVQKPVKQKDLPGKNELPFPTDVSLNKV